MSGSAKMSPLLSKLRAKALSLPETSEHFPWGDRVVKVKGKVFVFMGQDEQKNFGCSLKLPRSGAIALELPFAEPTGYGLGKAGWVSLRGPELAKMPFGMLEEWLVESYRAVAPAKVVAQLDGAAPPKTPPKKAPAKKTKKR
jgi:predicted DNA-binding protein (MmcQ/YjbR family)